MDKQIEYLKFLILLAMENNIEVLKQELDWATKMIKTYEIEKNNIYYEYIKEKARLLAEIKKIKIHFVDVFGYSETTKISDIIYEKWSIILNMLINKDCDYEFSLNSEGNDLSESIQYKKYYNLLYFEKITRNLFNYNKRPIYVDIMTHIRKENLDMIPIYSDLILNRLFHPNRNGCGTSNEIFWTSLPNIAFEKSLKDLNKLVICDERTDYHLLGNGSDLINCFLGTLIAGQSTNYSDDKIKYNIEIIDHIFRNNCSILDTYRDNGNWRGNHYQPLIHLLFEKEYCDEAKDMIENLRLYLLSPAGITNQISVTKYPTIERNKPIDYYIKLIETYSSNQFFESKGLLLGLKK